MNLSEKKKELPKQKIDLSEEDARLKKDIDEIVDRIIEGKEEFQRIGLDSLFNHLKTTESVTQIPKALKFLRPHYEKLTSYYPKMIEGDYKLKFADILSLLAMVVAKEGSRDCLFYKLHGNYTDVGQWGYEYVRFLAGEIGQDYEKRAEVSNDNKPIIEDLQPMINVVIPFMIGANAEPDACDLLIEVEQLGSIVKFCDKGNYVRVCLYLQSISNYVLQDERLEYLSVVYEIFKKLEKYPEALNIALSLNDQKKVIELYELCKDPSMRKQLTFMLSRQKANFVDLENDPDLSEIFVHGKRHEYFQHLAKELDALESKDPEDIYKTKLLNEGSRSGQYFDSTKKNLASTYVNAFANAGFGKDTIMTVDGNRWIYKNKDLGMLSATASLGLIYLYNFEEGLNQLDKYLYSQEENIKAGAILAQGICSCGVQNYFAKSLMEGNLEGQSRIVRIATLLGMGIAYGGTNFEDCKNVLLAIASDSSESMEILSFAALALGMIFPGSCNEEISETLVKLFMDLDSKQFSDTVSRFLSLGLGLLYYGKQDVCEPVLQTLKALVKDKGVQAYIEMTVLTCAYAGTGNVLKVQHLLKVCGEHIKDEKAPKGHLAVAVVGIGMIAMGEELGSKMAQRSFNHILQYCDPVAKRAVPLAMSLLSISNPQISIMDSLSKLTHDSDVEIAQAAILGLGLIGAGTNNARIAQLLRQLSVYYSKDAKDTMMLVRISQGLLALGKGLFTMSPLHSGKTQISPSAIAGLFTLMHAALDMKGVLLGKYHYILFALTCAIHPRMLITVDEDLNPVPVSVRVGTAVDVVAQAGRPKTITGFQTHNTPVLLGFEERAEFGTEKYIPLTSILEGVVICKLNKEQ